MRDYRRLRDRPDPEYVTYDVDKAAVAEVFAGARRGACQRGEPRPQGGGRTGCGFRRTSWPPPPTSGRGRERIGYPVVLKIASPDILHKTDVGGVRVGLRNAQVVRDAFDLIVYRAQRYVPDARIWGCLVQEMVSMDGVEVLVGMNRDPQFGPLVTFGLGGVLVEVLKDVTFRVAPFGKQDAYEMLEEIRAVRCCVACAVARRWTRTPWPKCFCVNQLVTDFPIVEMDINPLWSTRQGAAPLPLMRWC